MENNFRIKIADMMLLELEERILAEPNNELLHRIKLYIMTHKSNCTDYIYTSNKYKESMLILTHIFRDIFADLSKEICDTLPK